MPCKNSVLESNRCKCHSAVMNAYKGMSHEGEKTALGAALRVYHFYHPEDSPGEAALTVGRWVNEGHLH